MLQTVTASTTVTTSTLPAMSLAIRSSYIPGDVKNYRGGTQLISVNRVPASVQVITAAQIRQLHLNDLREIVQYYGGMTALDSLGNGFDQQLGTRGYDSGDRLLVIVDGMPINDGLNGEPAWLYCSAKDIERVEIFSPSAPYDMRYAKVIYVHTASGGSAPSYNLTLAGGNRNQGTLALAATGLSLGSAIKSSWYFDRNFSDGARIHNALYRNARFTGNTAFRLTPDLKLNWIIRYGEAQQEYPGWLDEDELADDRTQCVTPKDGAENISLGNALSWEYRLNNNVSWSGSAAQIEQKDDSVQTLIDQGWAIQESYKEENRSAVRSQLVFPRTYIGSLTTGIDLQHNDLMLKRYTILNGTRSNKLSELVLPQDQRAFFIQNDHQWLTNGDLTLGVRSETLEFTGRETGRPSIDLPSGHKLVERTEVARTHFAGLSYLFFDSCQLFANLAQSVVSDPYAFYQDDGLALGHSLRDEFGIKYHSSETLLSKKTAFVPFPWRLELVFYNIRTEDDIFWIENVPVNYNSQRHGVEYTLAGQLLAQWNIFFKYNEQKAFFSSGEYTGDTLPMVPLMNYSAGLTYMPTSLWSVTLVERYTGEQWAWNDVLNEHEHLKAYDLVDLRADYKLEALNFFLSINNLFDRKYETAERYLSSPQGTYYIPGARRMWEFGVEYGF